MTTAKELGFLVMEERCDQCLYSADKIVSDARRSQLLRDIKSKDGYFICHQATIAGREIACRGDWDSRACGQMGRIAQRLNAVRFVQWFAEGGGRKYRRQPIAKAHSLK